ncbi:MAG TPA: ABC transporter permease [Bryobacteraceae bacterium]|jgi:putative ABC transport system permease protein|nr:ABC transporter permease [Bryobacteraceae bacterium]
MFRYLSLMFKNSLRNRRRSALTIVSIGMSLCLLGVLGALYRGLFLAPPTPGQELRLIVHHKVSITQPLPFSYESKIRQVPGVREAMVWQWFGGTYKDARDQKNFFARFCVEPDKFFRVRPEIALPVDQQQSFEHLRTAAIASADLAKRMNWKVGEKIFLTGDIFPVNPELTLVGIFDDPNTSETLFFSQIYLREMLGISNARQDMVGSFQVQVERADQVDSVAKTIDDLFANSTAPTKSESEQAFTLQFVSFLGNVKVFLMSICAAVTFTVLLVSANTMAMSVRERIREVGILKTLGYTPGTILFLILGEAGVLSLLGGAIGLLLAVGLTNVVRNGPSFIQAMKTLTITPDVGGALMLVAFIIGVASAFVPAFNASRTPILESLRNSG